MQTRKLGTQGLVTSAVGLGCMGMSHVYGPADEAESIATIHRALELGIDHLDTADVYGFNANEVLIGKALADRRERAVIATKFGMVRRPDGTLVGQDGSPGYARSACEASLRRLGTDYLDLLYLHRVDPAVPVEETVGAMAGLVAEGKVRFLGLCEVSPATLARAHAVHPISAVQAEYSLLTRDMETDVLPALKAMGVGFVAYSPFGRGLLTGRFHSDADLAERDYRRAFPRYQGENFAANAALVDRLADMADARGITLAQLSLAWLLARGEGIVPIPGTKHPKYVEQNAAAAAIELSAEDLRTIEAALPADAVQGERFRPSAMERLNR